jgi:hypothetical protein
MGNKFAAFLTLASAAQSLQLPIGNNEPYKEVLRPLLKGESLPIGGRTFLVKKDCFFIDRRPCTRILTHDNGGCFFLYCKGTEFEEGEFDIDYSYFDHYLSEVTS